MACRRSLVAVSALAWILGAGLSVTIAAQRGAPGGAPGAAQQGPKLSDDDQKRLAAVSQLVDDVASGKTPAPADVTMTWRNHFLGGTEKKTYVPYTIDLEPGKFSSFPVIIHVRLVDRQPAPAAPATPAAPAGRGGRGAQNAPAPAYAAGNFSLISKEQPVSGSLLAPAGDYDLYVAMQEKADKNVKQPKTVVMKQTLTLPDYSQDFKASDIILADGLEPGAGAGPYTIGGLKITPSTTGTFKKSGEVSFVMFIYNEGVAASDKPDVLVEYNFYQKTGTTEKFFNKTAPQAMNAQTLPPTFQVSAGHQLSAIQGVPLGSFPEGEYRLEIKVTDKVSSKTLTQSKNFTVTVG